MVGEHSTTHSEINNSNKKNVHSKHSKYKKENCYDDAGAAWYNVIALYKHDVQMLNICCLAHPKPELHAHFKEINEEYKVTSDK